MITMMSSVQLTHSIIQMNVMMLTTRYTLKLVILKQVLILMEMISALCMQDGDGDGLET